MIKAAGYVRVSTPIQVKEGESLNTQREDIKHCCEISKYKLTEIYADEGISGAKINKRPDLIRLLQDAKAKKFEYLIIQRLSRLGRNARDLLNIVHELEECRVKLISIKDNIDLSNSYGRAIFGMLSSVAQLEKDIIKEQMRENKLVRWKNNEAFIGKPPFGYRWNKKLKSIEIDNNEAETYKRIVSMYVDRGMTFRDIVIKLRGEGIKCKRSWFSNSTISYMLKNPAYYGHYYLNQYVYDGSRRTGTKKPDDEIIPFKIQPLISKNEWDKIQQKTEFNKVKGKNITISEDYWLRDILECGECGAKIKPHHGNKRKDGSLSRYYACYWSQTSKKGLDSNNKKRCSLPHIKAEQLEELIWSKMIESFSSIGMKRKPKPSYFESLYDTQQLNDQLNQLNMICYNLKDDLRKKKTARGRYFLCYEDDNFDKDEISRKLKENDNDIRMILSEIEKVESKLITIKEGKDNIESLKELINNNPEWVYSLQKSLYVLSPKDKKLTIENLLQGKIVCQNQTLTRKGLGGFMALGFLLIKQFLNG